MSEDSCFYSQNSAHILIFDKTKVIYFSVSLAGVFYNVKNGSSFITSKVRQKISVIPGNWHFNSHVVLETSKTPVFDFIALFFNKLFDVINDHPFLTPALQSQNLNPLQTLQQLTQADFIILI